MRILATISLLSFLLPQSLGTLILFKLQQHSIRQEIKQRITAGVPEEELVLLKIPKALERTDDAVFQRMHDSEFRYCGQMYDIVRAEAHGDTTWYYCISDDQETELFACLDAMIEREMSQDPERRHEHHELQRLLHALFLARAAASPFSQLATEQVNLGCSEFHISTWRPTPPSPPPQA